jgi:hypothetical protein
VQQPAAREDLAENRSTQNARPSAHFPRSGRLIVSGGASCRLTISLERSGPTLHRPPSEWELRSPLARLPHPSRMYRKAAKEALLHYLSGSGSKEELCSTIQTSPGRTRSASPLQNIQAPRALPRVYTIYFALIPAAAKALKRAGGCRLGRRWKLCLSVHSAFSQRAAASALSTTLPYALRVITETAW